MKYKIIMIFIIFIIFIIFFYLKNNKEYFSNCKKCINNDRNKCNYCTNCVWCRNKNKCINYRIYNRKNCIKNYIKKYNINFNKINLKDYNLYHYDDDCIARCGSYKDCLLLKNKTINFNNCKKCKNTFKPMIINFECDKYGKKKINCLDKRSFNCNNPNNLPDLKKSKPYYLIKKKSKIKKCFFCWNLI